MTNEQKAWVVAVNMGYGHQRTAYPLKKFAFGEKIINANNYEGISKKDKKLWESSRRFYEFISDFKKIPLVGNLAFSLFDKLQQIPAYYPERDLSKPILSLKYIFSLLRKGWGRDLIEKLKENPLPLITTFFIPAFMAEFFDYPGEIFCVICDADISRTWVTLEPEKSRIKYFAPNSWVQERLKLYGVKEENIFLTGYPLPLENIGTENMEILKQDMGNRILNLDPQKKYIDHYKPLIDNYIGQLPEKSDHPLTILFSIGGAGAQKELVCGFLKNLASRIRNKELRIILSVGIRENVKEYFSEVLKRFGLREWEEVEIIYAEDMNHYFDEFNKKLRKTDILWTKPSELSFYTGLGLPIIIAPSIGSQEDFNRKWLLRIGSGVPQEHPDFADQWIFDYLQSGRFAEAAMQGLVEAEKLGVYNIQKICFGGL